MVLQEFFNICLMKSLQLLNLCFILLSPASSNPVLSSEFEEFTCKEHPRFAKRGENVSITCKNNKEIRKVRVTFCFHHNDSCPDKSDINTEARIYAADHERIVLKNFTGNTSSVDLLIHTVQIFDHRKYNICLKADNGQKCLQPFLNVTAPYTIDEVKQQNDTTIVCKASGGHPERQLYWFDQHGTNLTHSSKLEATKAEDGSFFLSSILQMKSGIGGISYCCCFSNATCSDTCSVWTTHPITPDKLKSKEHTVNWLIPTAIVGVLVVVAAVLHYLYKRKKGPNDAHWRRMFIPHVLSNQREQIQQEAVSDRMLPDQTSVTAVLE